MNVSARRKLLMLPGPTNVSDRVMQAMMRPMVNHRSPEFVEVVNGITEKGRYLFQTKQNVVTISSSGTGGIEAVADALVRPGDGVVVPVFGEFSQRLAEAVEIAGGKVARVTAEQGRIPKLEEIQDAISKTKNLKAVYTVHNETSTGCAIPYIRELAKAAHEKDAFLVVDGVSSIGGYSVPLDAWGVDMCITGSQKCIAAPPGLVLIAFNNRVAEFVKKTPPITRYFDLQKCMEFLERGYTPFTPAESLFYALDEALAVLLEETLEKRVARHVRCASELYEAVEAMGLETFADRACRSNTIITVKCPKGVDDDRFKDTMSEDHDVAITGGLGPLKGKILRIGSMGNVTSADVRTTVDAMTKTFAKLGHPVREPASATVRER
ncbi:MAG: alanine--glyoxylate aminotransferase family protein [Nitrososphaerota archaeon]|jgi:aspartate aminotransferase-like enzyme|nr:alanine--glyoxylate aminotransferase family protein [Nitrososphaerota archaeon]MDG6979031.1 alanine--glyoxylate aminotransferase family protein [Nitrososphaerota archaeon]MDG7020474.1 alanine--glyoxylate aminotransferase family protein [Nitrososphaerota archaeon]MDG7022244.1 alanine--glyoxylate aminotransferase family protein [Nitrososphaerota archaeon]